MQENITATCPRCGHAVHHGGRCAQCACRLVSQEDDLVLLRLRGDGVYDEGYEDDEFDVRRCRRSGQSNVEWVAGAAKAGIQVYAIIIGGTFLALAFWVVAFGVAGGLQLAASEIGWTDTLLAASWFALFLAALAWTLYCAYRLYKSRDD